MTEDRLFNRFPGDDQSLGPMHKRSGDDVMDLQGLYDRCMGNLDLMERVLDKFEQRLPEELAELERVLELGDVAMIAQVAHRIKGSTSNVSADSMRRAAEEIEELGRAGRVADEACMTNLREQWRRYMDCRTALRQSAAGNIKHCPTAGL